MKIGRVFLAGTIAGVLAFLVGSALYMNPLVAGIYTQYANLPGSREMASVGGLGNWLGLMALGGVVHTIIVSFIYAAIYQSLKGGVISRGLLFGLFLWLIGTLSAAYNTWLLRDYPLILISIETFNGLIGSLTAGLIIAWICGE